MAFKIKADGGTNASVLSYNVPEPTSYEGASLIELEFPAAFFTAAASAIPESRKTAPTPAEVEDAIRINWETGIIDPRIFPNVKPSLNPVVRPSPLPANRTGTTASPREPRATRAVRSIAPPLPAPPAAPAAMAGSSSGAGLPAALDP